VLKIKKVDITDATVNILLEIDGRLYMTRFKKGKHDAMSLLIKRAIYDIIPIDKTQSDLLEFVGWGDSDE